MRWMQAMWVVMAATTVGCLEGDIPESGATATTNETDTLDPNDSDTSTSATEPDSSTTSPADTLDPNDSDPNHPDTPIDPNDPPDPEVPADPAAWTGPWCMPRAADYQPSVTYYAPAPEALEPECSLVYDGILYGNGSRQGTRYERIDDVLWVEWGKGWSDPMLGRFVIDDQGVVRQAKIGNTLAGLDLRMFGGVVSVFEFDAAGHLVTFAQEDDDVRTTLATQTWDGDRLLARTTVTPFTETMVVTSQTTFTYDDAGRLTAGTVTALDHVWSVAWTYDDAGNPSSVERGFDGEVYQSIAWTFAADGALLRRDLVWSQTPTAPVRFPGESFDRAYAAPPLDVGSEQVWQDFQSNPWSGAGASVPTAKDGASCAELPTTLDYGFPEEEREYELGMPTAERPNGIGFAYGANTYGWNYGDLSWYSHAGVHGFESGIANMGSRVESRIDYRAGRMAKEHLVTSGGTTIEWQRERSFEDDVLSEDRIDVTIGPWDYDYGDEVDASPRTYGRTLVFERDEAGFMIERQLVDDIRGLIERQTWQRDDVGRWLAHDVFRTGFYAQLPMWPTTETQACTTDVPCTEPALMAQYQRELDARGHEIVFREAHPYGDPNAMVEWTERFTTWDEAGRMLTRDQSYMRESWTYDDEGRVILEGSDYDFDGEPDSWKETKYDSRGRWISKLSYDANGDVQGGELRTFACE